MNHSEAVSFIWGTADLIRDSFKRGKYQDVILPLTLVRRIDSVLSPTAEEVFATAQKYAGNDTNRIADKKVTIRHPEDLLCADETLNDAVRVSPSETARSAFGNPVEDRFQEIAETNIALCRRVADDAVFAQVLADFLHDRLRSEIRGGQAAEEGKPV